MEALRTAQAAGVPVPEPIWIDTTAIFAEQAAVISFVEGAPLLDPPEGASVADRLAKVALQIHAASPNSEGARALPILRETIARRISEHAAPEDFAQHPLGMRVWERLQALLGTTAFAEATFVHGDFWPGNVMWHDARLTAVVDWEDAGLNDPAADVAYCATDFRYLDRDDIADRFVERYRAESGRSLESLPFWTLHSLSRALPDIDRWLPSWRAMGRPELTAAEVRERHTRLVEQALDETS